MPTTTSDISRWFDRGVEQGATHMIIVCDTFDYEDYPVYAANDSEALTEYKRFDSANMQKVMEVYDLRMSKAAQLEVFRVFNLPQGDCVLGEAK